MNIIPPYRASAVTLLTRCLVPGALVLKRRGRGRLTRTNNLCAWLRKISIGIKLFGILLLIAVIAF